MSCKKVSYVHAHAKKDILTQRIMPVCLSIPQLPLPHSNRKRKNEKIRRQ